MMRVPLRTGRAVACVSLGLGEVSTGCGRALFPPAEESEKIMGKSMPIDMRRVIRAAVDAALEEPVPQPSRKRRLSTGRVLLIGAGLVTAGKLAASSRGREVFGTLRDRAEDIGDRFLGSDDDVPEDEAELYEDEELDAEAVDDEGDEGEEPGDPDDEELDEDEPEPELEEDERPTRKAPARGRRSRTRS